jgi:acetyltransferase-like isoleucine patch superfamily enzyme
MLKTILEKVIKRRNPAFKFDESVTGRMLFELFYVKAWSMTRSYKLLLQGVWPAKGLLLGRKVQFFNLPNIRLGQWVQLGDYVYLSALGRGQLKIGNNSSIGAYSRLVISTSFNNLGQYIHVGSNVGLGEFAYLGGAGGLEIGDGCIIGQYLSCHPENHNFEDLTQEIRQQGVNRKGIKIGPDCWIGAKVTILDGVSIGRGCVIAAGAVVTKNMPDFSIVGGVPAKVLKTRN